jgi:TolA-binding protein
VLVSGPLVGSGMALHAGQRVRTGLVNGKLELDTTDSVRGKVSSAAPATLDIDALSPTTTGAPSAPGGAGPGGALDWSRRAAQGEFAAVIEAAERRGLENTLSTASLADLAALADSARYARRGSLAKRVLAAQRKRFPASGVARDAAFFLGRLAEDDGSGALEWYDRYLAGSPRGTYASQALGRKMMLVYQQRGATSARAVADDYLTRFPSGPYAAAARKIQSEPATSAP